MTVSIIYHTRFNNNARIAQLLSDILEERGAGVSIHPISEADPEEIPASDLYILGSPTQIGTLPVKMEQFLKLLKIPEDRKFAVFATYAEPRSQTSVKITEAMKELKALPVTDPLMLNVKDLRGPLEDDWESRLTEWSKTIPQLLR
jgi:flavorubredoxin